jgi:hypothetical protein
VPIHRANGANGMLDQPVFAAGADPLAPLACSAVVRGGAGTRLGCRAGRVNECPAAERAGHPAGPIAGGFSGGAEFTYPGFIQCAHKCIQALEIPLDRWTAHTHLTRDSPHRDSARAIFSQQQACGIDDLIDHFSAKTFTAPSANVPALGHSKADSFT